MTWSINQIETVFYSILALIIKTYSLCLNCNATLTFKIHIIQYLIGHFALAQGASILNQTVSNSRFAMINMSNY